MAKPAERRAADAARSFATAAAGPSAAAAPGAREGHGATPSEPRAQPVEPAPQAGSPPSCRGGGQIQAIDAPASRFVSPREVRVWLPPAYAEAPDRDWPVLYLHDGQNVFEGPPGGTGWRVDEVAQRLALAGDIQPPIIVAVASNGDRFADYAPWPREHEGRVQGGGAAAYGRYLVEELKPLIDARYRTRRGRADTAVGGASLGGLVSVWLLLAHAPSFGAGLVVSPSLWWAPGAITRMLRRTPLPGAAPPRVWLCVGGREGRRMVDGARRLREALRRQGWPPGGMEQPGGRHDDASWATRVEPMLRFLYAAC